MNQNKLNLTQALVVEGKYDAARLAKAHELNLFAPLASKTLESRIPAHLRTEDWFSFSTRARVIVYNKTQVKAEDVQNYADLANPKLSDGARRGRANFGVMRMLMMR